MKWQEVSIEGLVDVHIHSAPDIAARWGDDLDIARDAEAAGMGGILIKSHWTLTADRAAVVQRMVEGTRVFGGLALNRSVGWLNPRAVEVALQLGAKQIWMPTFDAVRPGQPRRPEPIIHDGTGRILPEVFAILDLVREADVILGTGHLAVPESVLLVRAARERGLKKILVTHPEATFIDMPVDTQLEIRGEGVYFERCYNDVMSTHGPGIPIERIADGIRQVGIESTVLSTDYGQAAHPAPSTGMCQYLAALHEQGFSWDALRRMAGATPAYLVGL